MLSRLIRKSLPKGQLFGALLGGIIGFSILLLGMQLYLDVKPAFVDADDFWRSEYIAINKRLGLFSALGGTSGFDGREIAELRNQDFVADVEPFVSSAFEVEALISPMVGFSGFRTNMFFESVPDRYIDVNKANWNWNAQIGLIPIVVPRNYLRLYNFGYASSQGLPQVSEELISSIQFDIALSGNGLRESYKGRIVGFSDRINSILVPLDFMVWANQRYADDQAQNPSRLLVEAYNPADPSIYDYLEENAWEVNGAALQSAKLLRFTRSFTWIIAGVGAVIFLLAMILFLMSFQLIIAKNRKRLYDVFLLGYSSRQLHSVYRKIINSFSFLVLVMSLAIVVGLRYVYAPYLEEVGLELDAWMSVEVLVLAVVFMLLFSFLQNRLIHGNLKRVLRSDSQ